MTKFSKMMTGAAAAALITVSTATPAQAARYDRDDGIDAGDVIAGVAIIGGIAAIASALSRNGDRDDYRYRDRYRNDYTNAVNSCGYEAERLGRGRGRVEITDVDRRSSNSYRVRGVIDQGYDGYGRNDRYGRDYDRYDRGYGAERISFTCTARANGRVTDFRTNRN